MPLGKADHTVTYHTLTRAADMFTLMQQLPPIGYRGDLSVWADDEGNPEWVLMVNQQNVDNHNQLNIRMTLGQTAIWDGAHITVISDTHFTTHYKPTGKGTA